MEDLKTVPKNPHTVFSETGKQYTLKETWKLSQEQYTHSHLYQLKQCFSNSDEVPVFFPFFNLLGIFVKHNKDVKQCQNAMTVSTCLLSIFFTYLPWTTHLE